jgi:nitroreductase
MDVLEAIHSRRSMGEVSPQPVARELVEQLLSAAVQAPNHYQVRPWRFVVLAGAARVRMGELLARALKEKFPALPEAALEKERARPLRAPLIIAVGVDEPAQPKVDRIENLCAAAAAVENLLLAAHGLGLAAKWRTGEDAHNPQLKEFLGFSASMDLIALVYLGYPRAAALVAPRPGFEDRTVWLD